MLEMTLRTAKLIQCSQSLGLVLFLRVEMEMLWPQFSLKKHTSNSLNRTTVALMTIQEFRKEAAGVHWVFSELLFKIRSMSVKCLLMRLSALMFCWTVSRGPCTSFVLAVFRLMRTVVMCEQPLFMAFHCEGAELSEVIPPLFVLEAASQRGWQPNKLPHNFLHGEEGRGGAPDSSFAGSYPLRATDPCFPKMTPGSGRAQTTGHAHQLEQHMQHTQN